jgi:hypothetical protein
MFASRTVLDHGTSCLIRLDGRRNLVKIDQQRILTVGRQTDDDCPVRSRWWDMTNCGQPDVE